MECGAASARDSECKPGQGGEQRNIREDAQRIDRQAKAPTLQQRKEQECASEVRGERRGTTDGEPPNGERGSSQGTRDEQCAEVASGPARRGVRAHPDDAATLPSL